MSLNRIFLALALPLVFSACGTGRLAPAARAPGMEYAEVCDRPSHCLELSRLVMGTDHLGKMENAKTVEILDEAVRLGINAFDTSPIYAERIEYRLGEWLRAGRTGLYVISKGGFPRDLGPGTYSSRLKGSSAEIAAGVREELDTSSRQLNGNIAIYLLHRDDADFENFKKTARQATPAGTILAALARPELRNSYGMLGVSNWETARVAEALASADLDPGLPRPAVNSPYFSLLEMSSVTTHSGGVQVRHEEMADPAFQPGIKLMPYSPLGGFSIIRRGWAEARRDARERRDAGDRYWGHAFEAIFHEANEKRFNRAAAFIESFNTAHGTDYTVDQLLNAYVLAHPRADFLVIGPRDLEQLRRTVGALRLSKLLTREDLDHLHGKE